MARNILLIAAVRVELDETIERFGLRGDGTVFAGSRGDNDVMAVVTGIGATRARGAMARLCSAHKPDLVISAGLAGGLEPGLAVGSVLEPTWVINSTRELFRLGGAIPRACDGDEGREPQRTLLTSDTLVQTTLQKRQCYDEYRAAAVDMETFHLARLAAEQGIALRAVRAVSDPSNMALPPEALDWVDETGQTRIGAVTASLLRQPSLVPDMMRLGRYVRTATTNLAQRLAQIVESL